MMNNSTNYKRLKANLEYLKMNQMINHLDDVIDFSIKNNLSFIDTLIKLSDYEIEIKEKNLIESMVKVAAFPFKKEISDFDFNFQPSINQSTRNLGFYRFAFYRKISKHCLFRLKWRW